MPGSRADVCGCCWLWAHRQLMSSYSHLFVILPHNKLVPVIILKFDILGMFFSQSLNPDIVVFCFWLCSLLGVLFTSWTVSAWVWISFPAWVSFSLVLPVKCIQCFIYKQVMGITFHFRNSDVVHVVYIVCVQDDCSYKWTLLMAVMAPCGPMPA